MTDRHKNPLVPFRPGPGLRDRLTAYARRTRRPVTSILTDALTAYLDDMDDARREGLDIKETTR